MLPIVNSTQSMPVESMALHQLISNVQENLVTLSSKQSLQLVNEIPQQLVVNTSKKKLTEVLNSILQLVIKESSKDAIHISAKTFTNLVVVHLKKEGFTDSNILAQKLEQVNRLVQQLGGCICVNTLTGTTISLTFLNQHPAAA